MTPDGIALACPYFLFPLLFSQVLRNTFEFTESQLDRSPLDLTRSGTTALLSIVTSQWYGHPLSLLHLVCACCIVVVIVFTRVSSS